jgi:zinc transport system ATP-binding protein
MRKRWPGACVKLKEIRLDTPIIALHNVSVRYNGSVTLEDVSLEVHEREILSIVGPNGGGKSTLLRVIMGFKEPYRGTVEVLGAGPRKAHRGAIGYLPQKSSFDYGMPVSVFDVVAMARYAGKRLVEQLDSNDRSAIDAALDAVEITRLRDTHFGSLSEGQKQRALIARAIAMRPRILLLDEPSTGLDAIAQDNFYQMLLNLRESLGLTIVMVSHDIGAVSSIVDRLACLKTKLHFHGKPTDCLSNEALAAVFGKNTLFVSHGGNCGSCGGGE